MSLREQLAGAVSFAHLLGATGRPPVAQPVAPASDPVAKKAEDDEDMKKAEDSDGEDETASKKGKKAGKKSRKSRRSEADDDEDPDEDGDDDEDEEGDDDDDREDMKSSARAARLRERARCAAIFADASAGRNPVLAAQLAFGTDLPRSQAIAVLRAGGVPEQAAAGRLGSRMASAAIPTVTADSAPAQAGPEAVAERMLRNAGRI